MPAYFNDAQRTATRDAGRIAGLEVLRIINEPTAASLAYGLDKRRTGLIAVYDLGGGTFDISILRVEDGVFQVLSTNGDTHLGGDDIDLLLIQRVLADFEKRPVRARTGGRAEWIQAIRRAVIRAKCDLSAHREARIVVEGFGPSLSETDHARRIRTVDPADRRSHARPVPPGAGRRRARRREARRSRAGRRIDAHPARPQNGSQAVRQKTAQRAQSRRGGRAGRRGPGGQPRHRQSRHAAAGRDAAVARDRNHGRRRVEDHPAQLDDPGNRQRDVHDVRRQSDGGRHSCRSGRAGARRRQSLAGAVQAPRHSADARGAAACPRAVSDRRQRHPERHRQGRRGPTSNRRSRSSRHTG